MKSLVEPSEVYYHPPSSASSMDSPPPYIGGDQDFSEETHEQSDMGVAVTSTFYVPTQGKYLESGFLSAYPNGLTGHDVTPEKWYAFLQEITSHAQFQTGCKVTTATMLLGAAGFIISILLHKAIRLTKGAEGQYSHPTMECNFLQQQRHSYLSVKVR